MSPACRSHKSPLGGAGPLAGALWGGREGWGRGGQGTGSCAREGGGVRTPCHQHGEPVLLRVSIYVAAVTGAVEL